MMPEGYPMHERNTSPELERFLTEHLTYIATLVAKLRAANEGKDIHHPIDAIGDREAVVSNTIRTEVEVLNVIRYALPLGATMDDAEAILPRINEIITAAGGQDAFLEVQAELRKQREEEQKAAREKRLGGTVIGRLFRR